MRRARGITLVEVLLATVVCGAGLAVISGAIATSIRTEVRADGMVRAARLGDLLLGKIEGGVLPLQSQTGTFEDEGEAEVAWMVEVQPATIANLQAVTITLAWAEGNDDRTFQLVRLVYQDPDATTGSLGGQTSAANQSTSGGDGR